jgi:YbbR domain-containing protein
MKWLRQNLQLKLLAIVITVGLWYMAQRASLTTVQRGYLVDLGIRGQASDVVVLNELPKVNVIVEGRGDMVDEVVAQNLRAYVDVSGVKTGKHQFRVHALVAGTEHAAMLAVSAKPSSVEIELDYTTSKRFPTTVELAEPPPPGYVYGPLTTDPQSVIVSGTSMQIARVAAVVVQTEDRIKLPGPGETAYEGMFALQAVDKSGAQVASVKLSEKEAWLRFQIMRAPSRASLVVTPKITAPPEYPYRIAKVTVSPASVVAHGSPAALSRAVAETEPIDLSSAKETLTRDVRLRPIEGVAFERPSRVKVTIEIVKEQEPSPPEGGG